MRITTCSLVLMLAISSGMAEAHDHRHHHHHDHRELEGKEEGGFNCGTDSPNAAKQAQAQKAVENWRAVKAASAADGPIAETTTTSVVIPTYVHLIYGSNPSENEVIGDAQRQIDVLNEALDGSGFSFDLREVQQFENPSWWTTSANSSEEEEMKTQTRVGGPDALNIWFNNISGSILGHAKFPFQVDDDLSIDGVVCRHSTKDGGTLTNYNEGDIVSSKF